MAREAISKENVTLFRCTNFSAIATGEHELFTTAPTPFMPIFLIVMLRQVAGFESVPSLSIGTNANVDKTSCRSRRWRALMWLASTRVSR